MVSNIMPWPRTIEPFSVPSAGRRSSPACDQVSTATRSPSCAPRLTGAQVRRWFCRFSIIWSDVGFGDLGGVTHDGRLLTSMSPKSGTTSTVATKENSPSSPLSMRAADDAQVVLAHGRVEGFAQQAVQRLATDLRAKRCSITLAGTLPGRNPLMRVVRFRPRPAMWLCRRSPAAKLRRRSRLPVDSIEACMLTPATGGPRPRLDDWDETVVRTRRLGRACLPQPFSFAQFGLHCQRVPVKGRRWPDQGGDRPALVRKGDSNPTPCGTGTKSGRLPIPPLSRGRLRRSLSQAMAESEGLHKTEHGDRAARVGPPRERKLIRGGRVHCCGLAWPAPYRTPTRPQDPPCGSPRPRLRCAAVPPTPAWPCARPPNHPHCAARPPRRAPFRGLSRLHLHGLTHRARRSALGASIAFDGLRDRWPACRPPVPATRREPTACGAID